MVLKLPARMETVRHSIRMCHHFLRIYIEFIVMMVNVKDLFCIQCITCELLLMQNNLQLIATLLSGLLCLPVASLILQALCIVIYQWRKKIFTVVLQIYYVTSCVQPCDSYSALAFRLIHCIHTLIGTMVLGS